MTNLKNHLLYGVVLVMMILVIALVSGCNKSETQTDKYAPQALPQSTYSTSEVLSAKDIPIELTYPQSDDQGHYVTSKNGGNIVVSGIVSAPKPPTEIIINGVATRPYRVENIRPYGITGESPVYRFHVPVVLDPADQLYITVAGPGYSRDEMYAPDRVAVINNWNSQYKTAPKDPWVTARLGNAYYADRQYTTALNHLQNALTHDRDSSWILYDLGMTSLALNRDADAIDYFDRSARLYPQLPDVYYSRGLAYNTTNDRDYAIRDFAQALDIFPNWAEPLMALALSYYVDRKFDDADRYANQANSIWPSWATPIYTLAAIRISQGRDSDGYILLDKAERLGPWKAEHHEMLAEKLFAKGNYNAAWHQLQIARKFGGNPSPTLIKKMNKQMRDPGPLDNLPWHRNAIKAGMNSQNIVRGKHYEQKDTDKIKQGDRQVTGPDKSRVKPERKDTGPDKGGVKPGGGQQREKGAVRTEKKSQGMSGQNRSNKSVTRSDRTERKHVTSSKPEAVKGNSGKVNKQVAPSREKPAASSRGNSGGDADKKTR